MTQSSSLPQTSLQRVLTTLSHQEPDRVPFFLLLTLHGAKELGMSIKEYFSKAEYVAEAQIRMRKKYRHDCLYSFFYAPLEIEAWGGEVIFFEEGPPNSGRPFIQKPEDIEQLQPPKINEAPGLAKVLQTIRLLKAEVGDEVPILSVVMSPFSVPIMQMGFEQYLALLYQRPTLFDQLMHLNSEFCVEWANAQLAAGATAICYFDPVSSTSILPREKYLETGLEWGRRTFSRIKGPIAIHLASGRSLSIANDLAQTGALAIGVSVEEDLAQLKAMYAHKLSILGNLNGIEMRRWTPALAEVMVRKAIAQAGPGGGFILSDNHGEIPSFVPEEILHAISDAVHRWGFYPLEWIKNFHV